MVKKIVKKETFTQDQLIQMSLNRELKEIIERINFIPEPTYILNVGDRVNVGNLDEVYIEEVVQGGKAYRIDFTDINNKYNEVIRNEHKKRYVQWISVRKYQEDVSDNMIKNKDISLRYMQQQISSLFNKVYFFGVDFEPEYQREFVWELEDKQSLIDSIFNNIDIGKFTIVTNLYTSKFLYEILDGKQRLRALLDYYEDRFEYKGKRYSDLSLREQDHIKNYAVGVAETEDITREQKLRYFLMLNKSGHVMDKAQLEKVEKMLEGNEVVS